MIQGIKYFSSALVLLLFFSSTLTISADNQQMHIVKVLIKGGETLSFEFDEEPTFKLGTSVIIKTKSYEVIGEYAYGQVLKIYPDTKSSSDIKDASISTFKLANNKLFVDNVATGSNVNVYSIDGKIISADIEKRDNNLTVDLSSLNRGTYIVKINNLSFKILKK